MLDHLIRYLVQHHVLDVVIDVGAEVVDALHQHHPTLERVGTGYVGEGGSLGVAVAVFRATQIGVRVVQEVRRLLQNGEIVRPDARIGRARPVSDGRAGAGFEQQLVRPHGVPRGLKDSHRPEVVPVHRFRRRELTAMHVVALGLDVEVEPACVRLIIALVSLDVSFACISRKSALRR